MSVVSRSDTSRSSTCRPLCVAFVVVFGWGLLAPAILPADETATPTRRSIARIEALDAWSRFDFGRDFAVDGPLLVAGAPSRDGRYSGTAYVLELLPGSSVDGQMVWLQQARLYDGFSRRAPNPGEAVDLDGDALAVAQGSIVDFWQRDALGQWTLFDHFTTDSSWNDIVDVALRGDELLTVQTEAAPDGVPAVAQAERSGAVWQVLGVVPLPARAPLDVDGDRYIAGTMIADRDLFTGLFEVSTTLSPPPGSESSGFGDASALAGEVVAVGAPADAVDGSHSGSVYVYERDPYTDEWLPAQRLAPSNAQAGRRFGSAVDVDADRLLVAAPGNTSVPGVVYVFERDSSGDFVETLMLDAQYDAEFATAFIPGPVVLDGELAYARGRTPQGTEAIFAFYLGPAEVEPGQAQFFVPPQCASEPVLELRGKSVSIDEHQSVSYRVDGGAEHYLCLDCHPEPAFTFGFDVALESCRSTRVDLEVQSYVGAAGGDSVTLYYDPQPPSFDCTPRTLVIPYGEWVGGRPPESAWVDVSDNCPAGAARWCYIRDLWDSFRAPLGTSKIECLAIDRCHESTCVYDLTVYEDTEPIAPSCQRYDFRSPDGLFLGGLGGFTEAELGDGETVELLGGTRWMVESSSMLDEGDNGAFFYQAHERDVRLEMDVPISIYGFGGDDAKAGLMIRRDLDMWAPRMMAMWVPASGVIQFHLRPQAGDAGHFLVPPVPLGEIDKMALEIAGDTVTASVSEDDGATWQVLGAAILELGATPLVGMAASSDHEISIPGPLTAPPAGDGESPQALVAASYGDGVIDVRLERLVVCSDLGPPLDSCASDDFADWQAASLGSADQLDVQLEGGVLSLTAAGSRSDDADNMGFAYREVTGDFFATVAVDSRELDGGERRAASLVARTDLDADGRRLAVSYFPQGYYRPYMRITVRETGGEPLSIGSLRPFGAPQMLMAIERRGDTLIARHSYDEGRSWESSETWQTNLPATLLVGVAVESDDAAVAGTASFSNFTLCGPAGDTLPTCGFDDFGDDVLADEWTVAGVGNANQVSVAESGGVLELTADGATAFAGADNAGFVYRAVTGDFRAEVTVDGEGMVTGGAFRKAGLMVRAGLDPWAVRLLAQLVPYWNDGTDTHLQVVAREERGGWGNIAVATDVTGVPRMLRLAIERRGDLFEVQYSTDGGATWTTPGGGLGGTIVLGMPATVLVGLDMVSNDISVTSTARFDAFSLCPPGLSGCRGDDFEDDAVGAEWSLVGVGNANQVSAAETGGVLELTADGATAFAGADNAGLLYRAVTGDFRAEVTVDGEGMDTGGAYRKAGLMLRADLDPWAVRVLAQLAPYWNGGPGTHLQMVARETPGGWGNIALAADIEGVPRQLRLALERQGDDVSVHYSEDGGLTWTSPGSIELDLPETVYLGLDVVSNDISVTSTARFDDFFVCTAP